MIRYAREEDLEPFTYIVRDFHNIYLSEMNIPFDTVSFNTFLHTVINNENYKLFVCEKDGQIKGGLIGMISPCYFNHQFLIATEIGWFFKPKHFKVGISLIKAFEIWAQTVGAKQALFLNVNIPKVEKVRLLFESQGYVKSETIYKKDL